MAVIGKFTKTATGYRGTLTTLGLTVELEFQAQRKENERSPDFRIIAVHGEVGAAWSRTSAAEREYLSCKLDDPQFPAPLFASLVLEQDDETYALIWSR